MEILREEIRTQARISRPALLKRLYNVAYYGVARIRHQRFLLGYLSIVMVSLQLFHFSSTPLVYDSFSKYGQISYWIQIIENSFALYPLIPTLALNVRIGAVYVVAGLCLFSCLLTLLSLLKATGKTPVLFLSYYVAGALSNCLYLPSMGMFLLRKRIIGTLMLSFKCDYIEKDWVSYLDSDVGCFSSDHIGLIIISFLGGLGLLVQSLYYKLFVHGKFLDLDNPSNGTSVGSCMLSHILRTVLLVIFVGLPKMDSKLLYGIMYFLVGTYLFWTGMRTKGTYCAIAERTTNAINAVGIWLALTTCALVLWESAVTYLLSAGLLFIGPLIAVLVFSSYHTTLFADLSLESKNESAAFVHHLALIRLVYEIKKESKEENRIGRTFIAFHYSQCQWQSCPLTYLHNEISNKSRVSLRKHLNSFVLFVQKSLMRAIEDFPHSLSLRALYVAFLVDYTNNLIEAWAMLSSITGLSKNVIQDFEAYVYSRYIKELAAEHRTGSNVISLVMHQKAEAKFTQKVEANAGLYRRFWGILEERNPDYDLFENISFEILRRNDELEETWKEFKTQDSLSVTVVFLYGAYCERIQWDFSKAEEVREFLQQAKSSRHGKLFRNCLGNALVTLHGSLENLGYIQQYNSAFCSMFGYTKDELLNIPLSVIIPAIYRKSHEAALMNSYHQIEAGKTPEMKEAPVFVVCKNKYILPVILKMLEYPNFANGNLYVASLTTNKHLISHDVMHLLLDPTKSLAGVSSNCVSHLGITREKLDEKSIKIYKVLPNFDNIKEETTEMVKVEGSEMRCIWNRIMNRKEELLGYYVQLTLVLNNDCSNFALDYNYPPLFQFVYSFEHNKFIASSFLEATTPTHKGFTCNFETEESGHNKDKILDKNQTESSEQEHGLFYTELIKRAEMLCQTSGDSTILKACKKKPNYGKDVSTYRITAETGQFLPVDEDKATILAPETFDALLDQREKRGDKETTANAGLKKIFNTTIKNKAYLIKLLGSLPLPITFNVTLAFSLICMVIVCVIAIVEYIVFSDLFEKIAAQMAIFYLQIGSFSDLTEVSSTILQAVAYNSGYVGLKEAHPRYDNWTEPEFGNWTIQRIPKLTDNFNYKLINRRNIPYASVMDNLYSATIDYDFKETNETYKNVFIEMAYLLILDTTYNLTSTDTIKDFVFENPYVINYEYNVKNPIFEEMKNILMVFSRDMQNLALTQQENTNLIVYLCLGLFVLAALVQLFFIISLNFSIFWQAGLLLVVPRTECKEREKAAGNFLNEIRVTDFDTDSLAESESSNMSDQRQAQNRRKLALIERETAITSERDFSYSFTRRLSYIWRSVVFIAVLGGYIAGVSGVGNGYFNNILEVSVAFNNSARINNYVMFVENFVRSYYINPEAKLMFDDSLSQVFVRLNEFYGGIDEVVKKAKTLTQLMKEEEKNNAINFIYYSMCSKGYHEVCDHPEAASLGVLSGALKYCNTMRSFLYSKEVNIHNIFTNPEYIEANKLLYFVIRPGLKTLHDKILESVSVRNKVYQYAFRLCLVLFIVVAVTITIFMWIPYIQAQKASVHF